MFGVDQQVSPTYTWMQTLSAAIRLVVGRRSIRDLPLNGCNFIQLAQLLPGIMPDTPGSLSTQQGGASLAESSPETGLTMLSANGARDPANRYSLDGLEFPDFQENLYPLSPSIGALTEVKVETNSYSALCGAAPRRGVMNRDLAFARAVNLLETLKIEFRAEIFNAANHFNPVPGAVNLNLQSRGFGSIGGGVQGVTTRGIQLAAKIQF